MDTCFLSTLVEGMATPVYPLTTTTSLLVNTRTTPKIVYLPAASTIQSGKLYFIKDICGNAGVSSIFVSTTGQDQLDGRNFRSTNYGLLSTNFQSILLASDGFLNWMILQNYNANVLSRGFRGTIAATGGIIVSAGGITYHVFTTSGTFTVTGVATGATANYLVVGGGGGGGDRHGGGGGAGGVLGGTFSPLVQSYTITVGNGGAGGNYEGGAPPSPQGVGQKGGDSSISGIATAFGGGGGGTYDGNPSGTFGSGGGGGGQGWSGIGGTAGQGNAGGAGLNPGGGGGGGAGGVGSAANTSTGGIGSAAYSTHLLAVGYGTTFATSPQSPISGGIASIAGGGGGAANSSTAPTARSGGLGGGGTGDWDAAVITAGTSNTGGGGGASRSNTVSTTGRNGGSGLVLIWYT